MDSLVRSGSVAYDGADPAGGRVTEVRLRPSPAWDVWGCLRRRTLLIGAVSALLMAASTLAILTMRPTYHATSAVIFQGDRPSAARGDDALREATFGPDTLANEVELLLSEEVLSTVVNRLDLVHDPEYSPWPGLQLGLRLAMLIPFLPQGWQLDAARLLGQPGTDNAVLAGPHRKRAETVMALRSRLSVNPVGVSRVIRIVAQSGNPVTAARLANAVADAYLEALTSMKDVSTAEAHRWIEQRVSELRDRATRSALAYEQFRHANGLVRGKDSTISQEQVTQVSMDLTKARQARLETERILSQTDGNYGAELDQLNSPNGPQLLARLREQLATATARLAELQTTGGASMPGVMSARAQVADLTRSIDIERERIRQTLRKKASVGLATEQRLEATLADLTNRIGASDTANAQAQALERAASADREVYANFLTRARQTDPELTYQTSGARILTSAVVPLRPASPNKAVLFPAALTLSLGLATLAAMIRDSARRGVHSLNDLPGGPQTRLGMLPQVPKGNRRLARAFDEAAAQILARVLLPRNGMTPASIVITSALPREGKTRAAIALAKVAKDRGLRVLLVDADLRTRRISAAAGLLNCDRTLVKLLRDEIPADEADTYNSIWDLFMLPAGTADGSPMRLLATGTWEVALRELENRFDLLIIDAPPVLLAGDAWLLARPADATILVTRWCSTPLSAIELALEQLATAKAKVAGFVLTMVSHREHARYGHDDAVMFSPQLPRYHDVQGRLQ